MRNIKDVMHDVMVDVNMKAMKDVIVSAIKFMKEISVFEEFVRKQHKTTQTALRRVAKEEGIEL